MSIASTERKHFIINAAALGKASSLYRALYHPLRLRMIEMIHKEGRLNVTSIVRKIRLEQSLVSSHLKILRDVKLLTTQRDGQQIFYSVNKNEINRIYSLTNTLLPVRQSSNQKLLKVKKISGEIRFTPSEKKVIRFVCEQYTSEEIAEKLSLSKRTIEEYRSSILKKIKARNSVGILIYAVKNGLFQF